MRALKYEGNDQLVVRNVPVPEPKDNEALIKVSYTGICGSDLLIWEGNYPRVVPPITIGHEFSGTVEKKGREVTSINEGSRVVINPLITCNTCDMCNSGDYNLCPELRMIGSDRNGGMAEFVAVPENQLFELPESVSLQDAALIEPLAVGVHMVEKADIKKNDNVLIVGAGPIGLITASIAKEKGATVYISEINEYRIKHAKDLGFICVNPTEEDIHSLCNKFTKNKGINASFEVTGSEPGLKDCINITNPKGKVILAGMSSTVPKVDTYMIVKKELNIVGSRVYNDRDYYLAINLIENNQFHSKDFVTDILSLDNVVEQGFHRIRKGEPIVKAIISMN